MNRRYLRFLKWWFLISSTFVLLDKVLFQHSFLEFAKTSSFFGFHEKNNKETTMGVRKLLENGEHFSMLRHNPKSSTSRIVAKRLPACIIIGARKCGTRALLEFLDLHPQVVIKLDEMHFFSNDTNFMKGFEWYRSKMPYSTPDQITIEKTPRYFIIPHVPERMHQMNNSIKVIVILRHPTTRVVSDFTQISTQRFARNESMKPFEQVAINSRIGHVNLDYKAIQISVYQQHISRWLKVFPLSQIHFVDGDNLIRNPISEISKVETFLGLKHEIFEEQLYYNSTRGFYCMHESEFKPEGCLGAGKGRKHIRVKEWVRKKLNNYFKPHNEILYKLIKRRFPWR